MVGVAKHMVFHSVQVWTCSSGSRQQWILDDKSYEIRLKSDGNCLDISGRSTDNGANIYIFTCHPDDRPENQQVSIPTANIALWLSAV